MSSKKLGKAKKTKACVPKHPKLIAEFLIIEFTEFMDYFKTVLS